ncbi:hypothetical protein ZWY2020_016152 [Hordeum vulgare]|nr:hypothetical protein ZWY2020_016152 [Hordeum vulgare]
MAAHHASTLPDMKCTRGYRLTVMTNHGHGRGGPVMDAVVRDRGLAGPTTDAVVHRMDQDLHENALDYSVSDPLKHRVHVEVHYPVVDHKLQHMHGMDWNSVMDEWSYCLYDTDASTVYGVCAFLVLLLAQLLVTGVTRCLLTLSSHGLALAFTVSWCASLNPRFGLVRALL